MIANPKAGEYMTNTCLRCNRIVRSRLVRRSVKLARTRLVVPEVLVDVCPDCGHMISISPESVEQLREAGSWK
jgi:DNA-directed RNA polymerase subunit RPC12/RpoP